MLKLLLALAFYLLGIASLVGAGTEEPILQIAASPRYCIHPCQVRIKLTIRSNIPEGSVVCVLLDSVDEGTIYTSSCWPHTGYKVTEVTIKDIPTGVYVIEATVNRERAHTNLEVV